MARLHVALLSVRMRVREYFHFWSGEAKAGPRAREMCIIIGVTSRQVWTQN